MYVHMYVDPRPPRGWLRPLKGWLGTLKGWFRTFGTESGFHRPPRVCLTKALKRLAQASQRLSKASKRLAQASQRLAQAFQRLAQAPLRLNPVSEAGSGLSVVGLALKEAGKA